MTKEMQHATIRITLKFVLFVFVIPVCTIAITYIVFEARGLGYGAVPFISATLDYPPGILFVIIFLPFSFFFFLFLAFSLLIFIKESCVGTFGLSLTSTLVTLLTVLRV